jgi:predicted GH43/DUF377 family glycosyl hydrolase
MDAIEIAYKDANEKRKIAILNGLKLESHGNIASKRVQTAGSRPFNREGIFNPSCVQNGKDITLIYRCEPMSATWQGYFIDHKGVPAVGKAMIVNGEVVFMEPEPVDSGMPTPTRPEDWRLFRHAGKTYTNFTNYFYYNQGFPQSRPMCRTTLGILANNEITYLREMDASDAGIVMGNEEKNWVFFSESDRMFAIYSMEPFCVMECSDTGKVLSKETFQIPLPRLGNRFIANSTNPIKVTLPKYGEVWLAFCHQFYSPHGRGTRNRTYYQHAIIFEPKTHRPIAWSNMPIIGGGISCEGRHDGVVYVSGCFQADGKLYLMAGEADTHSCMYTLELEELETWLDDL